MSWEVKKFQILQNFNYIIYQYVIPWLNQLIYTVQSHCVFDSGISFCFLVMKRKSAINYNVMSKIIL